MADDPLDFSEHETKAREARTAARQNEEEAEKKRWRDRGHALHRRFAPLFSWFACWTNRRLCFACFFACVPPALVFVVVPLLSEQRSWPANVLDHLAGSLMGLFYLPGLVCTAGTFLSLFDAFSAYGSKFAGRDDEGDAIMQFESYQCPRCSARWKWCKLPAFGRSYQCPECKQVRRLPKAAGPRSYTLVFALCAFAGNALLVCLLIRG